jgi:hypothetical protein
MRRTLIRLVEYALEHARVPDKIIFSFWTRLGGMIHSFRLVSPQKMTIDDPMPTHSVLFE